MTDAANEREADKPNEFGFAGAATAPQPERRTTAEGYGENIAVPSDDLTGSIVAAVEGSDDDDAARER